MRAFSILDRRLNGSVMKRKVKNDNDEQKEKGIRKLDVYEQKKKKQIKIRN